LREGNTTLAAATAAVELFPQVLLNVRTRRIAKFSPNRAVKLAVADAESALDGSGRVLLRASGTEPVIRVMVEGKSRALVTRCANSIADAVRRATR